MTPKQCPRCGKLTDMPFHTCGGHPEPSAYTHPTTLSEFEAVYRKEYEQELASCDRWIKWCQKNNDSHGVNFHEGMRSALVFNDIKMHQLIRVLKQEPPNNRQPREERKP